VRAAYLGEEVPSAVEATESDGGTLS
jgi:hypothetical protein